MPGVTDAQVTAALPTLLGQLSLLSVAITPLAPLASGVQNIFSEPPLACYVFAACSGSAAPTLRIAYRVRARRSIVRFHVSVLEGYSLDSVPGVTVRLAGHSRKTDRNGNVTFTTKKLTRRRYRVTATRPGCNSVAKVVVL
jgi:hypothetical protein